jgi:hypothetical protein
LPLRYRTLGLAILPIISASFSPTLIVVGMGFPFVGRLADRKREQAEEATKAKEGIDASLITNYCYKSYWLMYIDMPHFALQLSLSPVA